MGQVSERDNEGDQAQAIEGVHSVLSHVEAVSESKYRAILGMKLT